MVEVFCDGGSRGNPGPAAWGVVLKVDGQITKEDCGYIGIATNNFAEYTALVEALSYLEENFEKEFHICCFSGNIRRGFGLHYDLKFPRRREGAKALFAP